MESTLAGLVSKLGRNRTFRRRLPPHLGGAAFYASTEGGLKYLRRDIGEVDPELTRFAQEHVRPGDVIWDIGANVGLFSFAAAGLAGTRGRVVAVEADTWLASNLISASRRLDRRPTARRAPVDVVAAAVSDRCGVSILHIANRSRATNHLAGGGSTQTDGTRHTQPVPTVTLDSLLDVLPAPSVMKIDVERAELQVVRGGRSLLRRHRPRLLVEVGPDLADDLGCELESCGYRFIDWRTGRAAAIPPYSCLALPAE